MTGTLYGVGVGPGDPELLTLKAVRIIASASVIAYPQADDAPSFARSIVADRLEGKVEEPIVVPMRTERFPAQRVYDEAAERLRVHLDEGRDVAVLCEGDPFFYGSFLYLYERVASTHDVRVVPGVSSMLAAASAIGRPLARRDDTLSVLPATLPDDELEPALLASRNVVVIKLGRHFKRVFALFERLGLVDSTSYCERLGLPNQHLASMRSMAGRTAPYFSLLLCSKGAE